MFLNYLLHPVFKLAIPAVSLCRREDECVALETFPASL